mmetsp:Transcript_25329/g.100018  ORF Transcript_25329/g.100018 Transcript_25329/m.100018 type:complete len:126 (-) Transcript_25329:3019-3396(-)
MVLLVSTSARSENHIFPRAIKTSSTGLPSKPGTHSFRANDPHKPMFLFPTGQTFFEGQCSTPQRARLALKANVQQPQRGQMDNVQPRNGPDLLRRPMFNCLSGPDFLPNTNVIYGSRSMSISFCP